MTKRLFAYIGLSMLVTFAVVFYFGVYGIAAAISCGTVMLLFSIFYKSMRKDRSVYACVAVVILLSTAYLCVYNSYFEISTERYNGKSVTVEGRLEKSRKTYDVYYYEIKSFKIDGKDENKKILLNSSTDIGGEYGDIVTCDVKLSRMDNAYYRSRRFDYKACSDNYFLSYTVQKTKDKDIGYIPEFIRGKLTYSVSVLVEGYGGELCNALTLGDKAGLSKEVYKEFQKTGLSYLIVISGLHMSIIAGIVFLLTRRIMNRRVGKWISLILNVSVIVLYMAVTGFSSSAVRSGIMILIVIVGRHFYLMPDPANSLGFAAFCLTVLNPYAVGDVGMLMSFASTAGIIFIYPLFIKAFIRRIETRAKNLFFLNKYAVNKVDKLRINAEILLFYVFKTIYELITISIAAIAAIVPLTLAFYGTCNPFVFLYSIIVSPFIGIIMIFTLLSSVLWYVPILSLFSYATAFLAKTVADFVIFAVGMISKIPFTSFYNDKLYMQYWLAFTIVLFIGLLTYKLSFRNVITASVISLALFVTSLTIGYVYNYDKVQLKVLNTGGGSTVVFKSPHGVDVLSSGGKSLYYDDTAEKLHTMTDRINLFVMQSPRESADVRYASDILGEFDVDKVLLYYRYNTNERVFRLARECKKYSEFKEGEKLSLRLSANVKDTVLNKNAHTWQFVSDGNTSVLIAPYRGKAVDIPEEYKNPDYLIINNAVEGMEEIEYGEALWTSDKKPPTSLKNVTCVINGDYTIDF